MVCSSSGCNSLGLGQAETRSLYNYLVSHVGGRVLAFGLSSTVFPNTVKEEQVVLETVFILGTGMSGGGFNYCNTRMAPQTFSALYIFLKELHQATNKIEIFLKDCQPPLKSMVAFKFRTIQVYVCV